MPLTSHGLNILSRPKGIETLKILIVSLLVILSEYTFPLEGNGNFIASNIGSFHLFMSEYTFPLEGN